MNEENYVVPTATMNETASGYELTFELPGIDRSAIELKVENRSLTLKTHATQQMPAGCRQVVAEFETPNYAASVDLPETSDPATITAKVENGLLLVNVAKRPETQARAIEIL